MSNVAIWLAVGVGALLLWFGLGINDAVTYAIEDRLEARIEAIDTELSEVGGCIGCKGCKSVTKKARCVGVAVNVNKACQVGHDTEPCKAALIYAAKLSCCACLMGDLQDKCNKYH